MFWFIVTSWRYLGCDRGTGRWAARRRYLKEIWGAARRYRALARADSKAA